MQCVNCPETAEEATDSNPVSNKTYEDYDIIDPLQQTSVSTISRFVSTYDCKDDDCQWWKAIEYIQ